MGEKHPYQVMPRAAQGYNLHDVSSNGNDVAIIVASGPSLDKNIELLAEIQDKVVIVTALRSVPVLNAAGIKPDIVVQLDAETDEVASKLGMTISEKLRILFTSYLSARLFTHSCKKSHLVTQ